MDNILDHRLALQQDRINMQLKGMRLQQEAQALLKSKEWKAAVKELKRRKMNTEANRNAMLTAWMNAKR